MADRIHTQFFCDSQRAHSHAGFTDSQGIHSRKWIGPMDSQFTTHNSQFTNESQFTRESQRAHTTKPTTHWHHPITSRWGLGHERDELGPDPPAGSLEMVHGFGWIQSLPIPPACCTPWGRILCLVGWLMVRGLCVVVCGNSLLLAG